MTMSGSHSVMIQRPCLLLLALLSASLFGSGCAFVPPVVLSATTTRHQNSASHGLTSSIADTPQAQQDQNVVMVQSFLKEYYPFWYSTMELNDDVWKAIGDNTADGGEIGYTIFVPSNDCLQALGETKQQQLMDPRNLETTQKIVAYHVIGEVVTGEQLYNAGGVLTLGGQIPIERTVTGGIFGIGGQEDGSVTINKARVSQVEMQVGTGLVHEVDDLVSPSILWRYMDQLRIPGSK